MNFVIAGIVLVIVGAALALLLPGTGLLAATVTLGWVVLVVGIIIVGVELIKGLF